MQVKKLLIELYDNMPTCEVEDAKLYGETIMIPIQDAKRYHLLLDHLTRNAIQFVVHEVGDCILDRSYNYEENYRYILENKNEN